MQTVQHTFRWCLPPFYLQIFVRVCTVKITPAANWVVPLGQIHFMCAHHLSYSIYWHKHIFYVNKRILRSLLHAHFFSNLFQTVEYMIIYQPKNEREHIVVEAISLYSSKTGNISEYVNNKKKYKLMLQTQLICLQLWTRIMHAHRRWPCTTMV